MRVDLDKYREAGRIASLARNRAVAAVRPGVRYVDVLDETEAFIRAQGGDLAFPAQVSVNHIAAHDCCPPDDPRTFQVGDVCKVDLGVHVDGCIADTAATADLGGHDALLEASRQALEAAIALVRAGARTRDLGAAIESAMRRLGLKPISNLTGHGIAPYTIHCAPAIPNVPEHHDTTLKEGMLICIEPFATTGRGTVVEQGAAQVFGARRKLKAPRHVDSALVEQIAGRKGLPFCRRELAREHGLEGAERGLRELIRAGVVFEYPPLVERDGAIVAQFEHTMLVGATSAEVMTR